MTSTRFSSLPSVDRVLRTDPLRSLLDRYEREPLVCLIRSALAEARAEVAAGSPGADAEQIGEAVARRVSMEWFAGPVTVINATGVILHTNLGRAPLSTAAIDAIRAAAGYSDLEYARGRGTRGSRQSHVHSLITTLTQAPSAYVTNNNAAAITLCLAALARGKEVIVSRGQAVEIGGGFRVPVILRQSGARLVEVGTTNRTRLADYEDAVSPRTGAILHVHSSNFRLIGFTAQPNLGELATLARRQNIPLIADNGSGAFLDTTEFGLVHEPTPVEALESGATVVTFSGDKLLGGPQSGIVIGEEPEIDRIARHPLARTVRPDKLALAALSATLLSYLKGDAVTTLPVWEMIAESAEEIEDRSRRWQEAAELRGTRVALAAGRSAVGGGSLPGETLPTTLLVLPAHISAASLRAFNPPVVARTHEGHVVLDLRTVGREQEQSLLDAVVGATRPPQKRRMVDLDAVK